MSREMPSAENFTGLSRKVMAYCEAFARIVQRLKNPDFSEKDWAPLEALVDVDNFVRLGVFSTDKAETTDWQTYKSNITKFGSSARHEATLRHITEGPKRVILELVEHNTRDGFTHIANTVMTYGFDDQDRIKTLEVYVMSLNSP